MMRSLRNRVTAYVLLVMAAVLVPFGVVSYRNIVTEFDTLADARLVQATRTIDVLAESAGLRNPDPASRLSVLVWRSPFDSSTVIGAGHPYEARLGFQYWSANNRLQLTSDNFESVPLSASQPGFAEMVVQGRHWRVFTLREGDNDTVRVAERFDSRDSIARALVFEHVAPLLIALPLLAVLVGWAVRRALLPLDALSSELARRPSEETASISMESTPKELEPVLNALNGLLDRVHTTLEREHQFTADAAHQMRTPLTAALLHLENALASDNPDLHQLALGRAREGLERLRRLVNQFLDLARWDSSSHAPSAEIVDLEACVRTEIEDAAHLASDKNLELSVIVDSPEIRVRGWEPALRALVRNVIDNAFRYTRLGAQVEVRLSRNDSGVALTISDSGPGIAPADRSAVFERFRRGRTADITGTGLGLAIVARIAELHGATVTLRESHFASGLCVEVVFPEQTWVAPLASADL